MDHNDAKRRAGPGALNKMVRAFGRKFLRADEIVHAAGTGGSFGPLLFFDLLDQARLDPDGLQSRIGDGTNSDVLMSTLRWIQRAAVEAPIVALNENGDPEPDSELQALFDRPNEFYTMAHLISATIFDLCTTGNAYWLPGEDGNGKVTELWWAPSSAVEPEWRDADPTTFIDHYLYQSGSAPERNLKPEDVLHFRLGVDPRNTRKGLSPLRGLLREILTDDEAAAFTAALLRNGGVPSLIISPTSPEVELPQEEIEAAVARLEAKFTGSGRGKVLGLTGPVSVEQFGFSPKQMDFSALRDVAEERVTAALGVPAAVVGFGAGLQTTRVGATMRELVQLAHHNGVIPLQRIIEDTVNQHLAPHFEDADRIEFDLTQVQALREDQDSLANRVERLVRAGIMTRAMALTELGFEPTDGDDVYLLQLSTVEIPRSANGNRQEIVNAQLEERRLLSPRAEEKQHPHNELLTDSIIENAPRANPTPAIVRFASRVDRIRSDAPERFAPDIERVFEEFGERVEQAVLRELAESGDLEAEESAWTRSGVEMKFEAKQDDHAIERAVLDLTPQLRDELAAALGLVYLSTARQIVQALVTLGIEFIITDPVQVEILRRGGLRAGLIDLDQQTRDALFDALADARAEGLAGENLARRIREHVTAGPWRDVATRARIIARTEGANAANTATLIAAREMEQTEHVMVLDDRTGFSLIDPSHTDCAEINGTVITIAQADGVGLDHPGCTRSFTPVNRLLMEELGLAE